MGISIFEAGMLIFFGVSWPISIYKSAVSKTARGKSLLYTLLVVAGYVCGVTHKMLYNPDFVMYLYILNLGMVAVDVLLTLRNRRLDREADAKAGKG